MTREETWDVAGRVRDPRQSRHHGARGEPYRAGGRQPAQRQVSLTATATDANGVTRVEFFYGATLIGADTTPRLLSA